MSVFCKKGYLKDKGCAQSYNAFLKESPDLTEFRHLLDQGNEFPTSIFGQSLVYMLDKYYSQYKYGLKTDKSNTRHKDVTVQKQVTETKKPHESLAVFQRKRGIINKQNHVQFLRCSANGESKMFQSNGSIMCESPSSPVSQDGEESPSSLTDIHPNSSTETQRSVSLLYSSDCTHSSKVTSTSTPGHSQAHHTHISQSFPFQSPIIVSDSDNPFSPESFPGTPKATLHQQVINLREIHESPKSRPKPLKVSSPLVKRIQTERVRSPSSGQHDESSLTRNVQETNKSDSDREKMILAMRTGTLYHLTKENLEIIKKGQRNKCPNTSLNLVNLNIGSPMNRKKGNTAVAKTRQLKNVKGKPNKLGDVEERGEDIIALHEEDCSEPQSSSVFESPIKSPARNPLDIRIKDRHVTSTGVVARTSGPCNSVTPKKYEQSNVDTGESATNTTLPFGTPFKTPSKFLIDGECSRDGMKTPKRKSQAPKRRSCDPNASRERILVTPAKDPPLLSMPLLDELVNNTKLAEKLAESINQVLKPEEESNRNTSVTQGSEKCATVSAVQGKEDKHNTEKSHMPHSIEDKQKKWKEISPSTSPKHFEKTESIDLTVSSVSGVDGNESTGSIKPPLSSDELNSILEDTHMSENTIQGIINMTQTDPEFDALFNLFNVDKHEFIEKEYGISLSNFKTTPAKVNFIGTAAGSDTNISTSQNCSSELEIPSHVNKNATRSGNTSTSSHNMLLTFSNITAKQDIASDSLQVTNSVHKYNGISQSGSLNTQTVVPSALNESYQSNKTIHKTTSEITIPQQTPSSTSFLQLLNSSNDGGPSCIETAQSMACDISICNDGDVTQHSVGFNTSMGSVEVTEDIVTTEEAVRKNKNGGIMAQAATDSTGSEDVIELPNGVKLSVLPAGSDVNAQLQSLDTLTKVQEMLKNGFSLTPVGPAITSATTTGSSSVITPVKLTNKPAVEGLTVTTPSPGTTSALQAVNTQNLCMIQPRFTTIDASGFGFVTCPEKDQVDGTDGKTKVGVKTNSMSQKRGRGRPRTRRTKTPKMKTQQDGRIVKNKRGNSLKDLSIPSVYMAKAIPVKTLPQQVGNEQCTLVPVTTGTSENIMYLVPIEPISTATSNMDNNSSPGILKNLLATSMASSILGPGTVTSLTSHANTIPPLSVSSSSNTFISDSSSGHKTVLPYDTNVDPSPTRRKLFNVGHTAASIHSKNNTGFNKIQTLQGDTPRTTSSIHSMGSMLLSPPAKKSLKESLGRTTIGPHINSLNVPIIPNTPGLYKIEKGTDNVLDTLSRNTTTVKTVSRASSLSGNSSVISTSSLTKNNFIDTNGLCSMPTDFITLLNTSPKVKSNESVYKIMESNSQYAKGLSVVLESNISNCKTSSTQARRVELKTLGPTGIDDSNNSFQSTYPNLISQSTLMSQPGIIEEIQSPTNLKTQANVSEIGEESCGTRISINTAMDGVEASLETAETLLEFSTYAVVTPKKLENDNLDENSNPTLITSKPDKKDIEKDNSTPQISFKTNKNRIKINNKGKNSNDSAKKVKKIVSSLDSNFVSAEVKSPVENCYNRHNAKTVKSSVRKGLNSNKATKGKSLGKENTAKKIKHSPGNKLLKHSPSEDVIVINSPPCINKRTSFGESNEANTSQTGDKEIMQDTEATETDQVVIESTLTPDIGKSKSKIKSVKALPKTQPNMHKNVNQKKIGENVEKLSFTPSEKNISMEQKVLSDKKKDKNSKTHSKATKNVNKNARSKISQSPVVKVREQLATFSVVKVVPTDNEDNEGECNSKGEIQENIDKISSEYTVDKSISDSSRDHALSDSSNIVSPTPQGMSTTNVNDVSICLLPEPLKTPEKQNIPSKLKPGPSPYRSLPLAKLLEVSAKEKLSCMDLSTLANNAKAISISKEKTARNSKYPLPKVKKVDQKSVPSSSVTSKNEVKKTKKRKINDSPCDSQIQKKQKLSVNDLKKMDINKLLEKLHTKQLV